MRGVLEEVVLESEEAFIVSRESIKGYILSSSIRVLHLICTQTK
jgi:hypothetical protein